MVIDVWATWCAPCQQIIPQYKKLIEKYKNDNRIKFISISIDEDRGKWNEAIQKEKPTWANYWMDSKQVESFNNSYQVTQIPRFIIIGKNGLLLKSQASIPGEGLENEILAALQ